ncbi:hypothetical protein LAZ67_X002655 [Cordylochernes scorpioides]|uniref:Uncharacterized protein n=1 Tax=Cordylochernes scorpioides TaxID=51811 RepID=A0ABY6LW52_9ARAC|nr:hypothetical protein LAZ67_X002655 [Cordylochernes scorpioides]
MNLTGSAKTWLNLHKASFTSWENIKIRLIQDFSLDANKEELRIKLNRMQHWNELAIRFAEDKVQQGLPRNGRRNKNRTCYWRTEKKEYSFALYLNPPKTTDELFVVCKKMDSFEKKYRERVEKSRNLYNGPRYSGPQQQSRYVPPTATRNYHSTSRPQAPVSNNYKNGSPLTLRQYRNNFPQSPTPRRLYNTNFVPKSNLRETPTIKFKKWAKIGRKMEDQSALSVTSQGTWPDLGFWISVLAESQVNEKHDGGTPTQHKPTIAEKSAEDISRIDLKNTFSIKLTNGDYVNQAAVYVNWAEIIETPDKESALESELDWKIPESNKRKGRESPTQPTKMAKAEAIAARPSLQPRQERKDTVTQIKSSRQQQELAKARSAAATFDQSCFIEWCPDFHQVQYMKALEQMMGKSSVYQLMKMSGHVLVTFSSTEKVERLIEEGLTFGSTLLRAFPYRKKAEKIIIGNLPIAVRDEDIVAALRPYCKVASMAYEVVTCEGYSWTTGSREAFVLLNGRRKLHQLPAKLVIISKGESTPAYITYGVRCSKCHRQGLRRATCPLGTPQSRPAHLQDNQNGLLSTILSSQPTSLQKSAAPTSAALGPDTTRQTPSRPSSPATSLPAANLSTPPQLTPVIKPSASAPNANRLTPLQVPSLASSQRSSVKTPAPAPTTTTAAPPPAASDHPAPEAAPGPVWLKKEEQFWTQSVEKESIEEVNSELRKAVVTHFNIEKRDMLAKITQYWILKSRRTIRNGIRPCARCRRFRAQPCYVEEGPLPKDRVRVGPAFDVTGVDMTGPLHLKGNKKYWIAIFTCATYRTIHLELCTSLTTETFIGTMRRFVARRGRPSTIYSDNGLNFVGCKNLFSSLDWNKIVEYGAINRISWKFNPPTACWWGGFWERMIGIVKQLLRSVLGSACVTNEELQTLLCDVEAVVNNRPLTYVSEDDDELAPLTTNKLINNCGSSILPEADEVERDSMVSRYRNMQACRDELRARFTKEYLAMLVHHRKAKKSLRIEVGEIVLRGNDQKKRISWPLGKVEEVLPGADGQVRVARVKTSSGVFLLPERPSTGSEPGEEFSPENQNMKNIKENSSENLKNANSPAGDMHANLAAARSDVTHLVQPALVALPAPMAAPRPLEPAILPLDIEMSEEERTSTPSMPSKGKPAIVQLREHLEKLPSIAIDHSGLLGLDWEDAQKLLASPTNMKKRVPSLLEAQVAAFTELAKTIMASCPNSNTLVYKTLQKTRTVLLETNAYHLGSGQDLCLGYNAVVLAHPVAISGSGLACVFGPGVAVLQQRILWPGHIALAIIDVHGEEMTAINVHLAHEPGERNQQLRQRHRRRRGPAGSSATSISGIGAPHHHHRQMPLPLFWTWPRWTTWPPSSTPPTCPPESPGTATKSNPAAWTGSSSLLEYWIARPSTRPATTTSRTIASCCSRWARPPPSPPPPSLVWPRCSARALLSNIWLATSGSWRKTRHTTTTTTGSYGTDGPPSRRGCWQARSLHDPRHAASDSYIYRAKRYIAAQLEASSIRADYPSLPDLARAIRLRRPVSVIRDEQDNIIEGPELRRRAYATFQPRFARPTSDPAAGAAFIASSALITTRELSEEDPLHRPDISPSEIANAIEHLPRGKARGWDGWPCELLVAFNEDFFTEALARVFAASRLRAPSASCPRPAEVAAFNGYRPVALPSADYRVLAAILHRRLRPHLRTLVPECQTYAVPGRSPSWNIAMVTDAVEEDTALGSPLAVMGVDLESAFDSLDRGFLESLLTSLRLPPAFRAWINILYAGADATIRAGSFYTTAFPHLNGLRQGCAVSAALISIATGPLLRRLELTLGVDNVIAYADDIVLLFHRDGDFERVATVFEEYKHASGVGVNLRKSAGLWYGAWRNRGDSPLPFHQGPRARHRPQEHRRPPGAASPGPPGDCVPQMDALHPRPFPRRTNKSGEHAGGVHNPAPHAWIPPITPDHRQAAGPTGEVHHTAWPPANVMARPVTIGGLGLHDLATQLQLACLKGVQVALRGGRNAFSWLVESGEAWIHPPPDGTRLQPRRLRLLKLWEEASNILSLNH